MITALQAVLLVIAQLPFAAARFFFFDIFRHFFVSSLATQGTASLAVLLDTLRLFFITTSSLLRHASAMADAVFNSCNSFQPVGRKITLLEARVNFGGLQQQLDQSVEDFAAVLRAAAVDCRFGAYLDEHLRDQFVFGLIPGPIHDLLLQEDFNITFSDAVKKASDLERLWSRPLLVPDWLAPQSIFSSNLLEVDNSASQPQLIEPTLAFQDSEPLQFGPHSSCNESGSLHNISILSSVALSPTTHSEPLLQLERGDASVPTKSTQSAPFEQIGARTPDPDLADLQMIYEKPFTEAPTDTLSHLESRTSDPLPTNLQLIGEKALANAQTDTSRSNLGHLTAGPTPIELKVFGEERLVNERTETFRSQLDYLLRVTNTSGRPDRPSTIPTWLVLLFSAHALVTFDFGFRPVSGVNSIEVIFRASESTSLVWTAGPPQHWLRSATLRAVQHVLQSF